MNNFGQRQATADKTAKPTLHDLDMALSVFPDALPRQSRHYARRALGRLAALIDGSNVGLGAEEILAKHAEIKREIGKRWYEEHAALKKVLDLPVLVTDVALRIRSGRATMRDALEVLGQQNWAGEEIRIKGCYDRLAEKLLARGIVFEDTPAAETVIEPLLSSFSHLDFGLQPKAWGTMKSRLRRLVKLVDIHARLRLSATLLPQAWDGLIKAAKISGATRGTLAKCWPLVAYCSRTGIDPVAVDDAAVEKLLEDLERRQRADAFSIARDAVYAWETLAKSIPSWPPVTLHRIYRLPGRSGRPRFTDLPEELQSDWASFFKKHRTGDLGIPAAKSLGDLVVDDLYSAVLPLSPALCDATLANLKSGVIGLAGAAIALGSKPKSLLDVVNPEVVLEAVKIQQASQSTRAKNAGSASPENTAKNHGLLQVVSRALAIARRIEAPAASITALEKLRDRVDPRLIKIRTDGKRQYRRTEIGSRHRKRIAAFNDVVKMHAWLEMPYVMLDGMQKIYAAKAEPQIKQIGDAIVAVLYAVSLCCPMRRSNLANLTVVGPESKIWLPSEGRGPGKLRVPATEVKNKVELHAELDFLAVKVLTIWMKHFRPALMRFVGSDPRNPYLLPAYGLKHRAPELLNKGFVDRNKKAGFLLNLHCQRHLCAKVILDEDPTQMELVRQFLAHTDIATTERYYAEVNAILVQQKFHRLLEARRQAVFEDLSHALD